MAYFTSVTGDIGIDKMGVCQPHEHVYIVETPALTTNSLIRLCNLEASIRELKLYREAGGQTLVDANPLATGRDALALRTASRVSGVQIIATTGYHIPSFYQKSHWIWTMDEEELTRLFTSELVDGMYQGGHYEVPEHQTGIRAGLVKAMLTEEGVCKRTEVLLRAAGRAAVAGGASLMLHTEYGKGALDAIRLLSELGLATERILICHVDRQVEDYGIHEAIADTGVYLEYDTITLFEYHNNISEVKLLQHMVDRGHLRQILLSTDPTVDRLKSYGGNVGMDYILTQFIPLLLEFGFTEEMIRILNQENPARALRRVPV
ncbi:MAG: phosphotriesterase [Lachnospiraceae bacterium]|jgi:predicted metal-dependent phosphotriesterase family hydrolase|nr:phosphotriesterase [Lachnospiraceae bacterium]